jgi:hypothetical protein
LIKWLRAGAAVHPRAGAIRAGTAAGWPRGGGLHSKHRNLKTQLIDITANFFLELFAV